MNDVPDEVKIFASDVFKAANRVIFLGYNSRLRGMWLKKEVNKIIPHPSPCKCHKSWFSAFLLPTKDKFVRLN